MGQINLNQQKEQALETLKRSVVQRYKLIDFRVFGSKARGDASPDSDIDLMIELEEYTPEIGSAIDDIVYDVKFGFRLLHFNCDLQQERT